MPHPTVDVAQVRARVEGLCGRLGTDRLRMSEFELCVPNRGLAQRRSHAWASAGAPAWGGGVVRLRVVRDHDLDKPFVLKEDAVAFLSQLHPSLSGFRAAPLFVPPGAG